MLSLRGIAKQSRLARSTEIATSRCCIGTRDDRGVRKIRGSAQLQFEHQQAVLVARKANRISDNEITPFIKQTLYHKNPRLWYWALMDYGAQGNFGENPNRNSKQYARQSRFAGSRRFVRAKILSFLLQSSSPKSLEDIVKILGAFRLQKRYRTQKEVKGIIEELGREGFLVKQEDLWRVAR